MATTVTTDAGAPAADDAFSALRGAFGGELTHTGRPRLRGRPPRLERQRGPPAGARRPLPRRGRRAGRRSPTPATPASRCPYAAAVTAHRATAPTTGAWSSTCRR